MRARSTVRKPTAPVRGVLDHVEVTIVWPQGPAAGL
jgi:dihydroneopterin aldolase